MVIYRAFRRELIEECDLDKEESYLLPERLFGTVISWEPLMSVRARKGESELRKSQSGSLPELAVNASCRYGGGAPAITFSFSVNSGSGEEVRPIL